MEANTTNLNFLLHQKLEITLIFPYFPIKLRFGVNIINLEQMAFQVISKKKVIRFQIAIAHDQYLKN